MATTIANLSAKQGGTPESTLATLTVNVPVAVAPNAMQTTQERAGLTGTEPAPITRDRFPPHPSAKEQTMSDRHTIETVLKGNVSDAEYATVTAQLPLTLAAMARPHDRAPDYRVTNRTGAIIGYGWNRTAKMSGQNYVAFQVDLTPDRHIFANASRPTKPGSAWIAQLYCVQ